MEKEREREREVDDVQSVMRQTTVHFIPNDSYAPPNLILQAALASGAFQSAERGTLLLSHMVHVKCIQLLEYFNTKSQVHKNVVQQTDTNKKQKFLSKLKVFLIIIRT